MHNFGLGVEKSEIKRTQEETPGVWGKGRRTVILHLFSTPLCESLLSFINGSDSRKPTVQREAEQLERLAPRAPKRRRRAMERGKPARAVPWSRSGLLCRGECGTAELAGGRRGVAVFEQGSGAITFFFFFCFK